jgi:transposase, IS30 family
MPYQHITAEQRSELGALLRAKVKNEDIADQLGKHRTSIWRERTRNKSSIPGSRTGYNAQAAQVTTKGRRIAANQRFRKIENNEELQQYILRKLKLRWTPEEISGTLAEDFGFTVVCHQTVYEYIYDEQPEWIKYLRHKKNKYRRRRGTPERLRKLEESKKKRIDTRPSVVEARSRIGDWEGDTIVGKEKTKRILTMVDRKSGKLLAAKLETGTAAEVREKTKHMFARILKDKKKTITYDNGSEFADHELIERDNKVDVYFAYPYHSWERGSNENTNGLIRQFFPKGTPFASITQRQLDRVVRLINTRPRKRHHYRTPDEVFNERCALD